MKKVITTFFLATGSVTPLRTGINPCKNEKQNMYKTYNDNDIRMTGALWRQLFHNKLIKFRLPGEEEYHLGRLDVLWTPHSTEVSIFAPRKNPVVGVEDTKLRLTQLGFEQIGWLEDKDCFWATFGDGCLQIQEA